MEKVNSPEEKVNLDPGKGQASVDSKRSIHTLKEKTEREAADLEKVNDQDLDMWVMKNAIYGTHRRCGHDHQPGTPCYTPGRRRPPDARDG